MIFTKCPTSFDDDETIVSDDHDDQALAYNIRFALASFKAAVTVGRKAGLTVFVSHAVGYPGNEGMDIDVSIKRETSL